MVPSLLDNPFARRASHSRTALLTYRALTPLSWLLVVVFGIYYSMHRPDDVHKGSTIGKQADINPTPFSQTKTITIIYWVILLVSQLGYMSQLWSSAAENLTAAANVAPYYVLNNLFLLSFILLWVRSYFWGAEIFDIASLINQGIVYWAYPGLPHIIHLPAVAGPYAWSITTLFWNGAVAVGGYSLPKRILANIFIWVMFLFGQAHVAHRSDQALGYSLSLLSFCKQSQRFNICLNFRSFLDGYNKRDFFLRSIVEPEAGDRERQPLLGNE
ncbi:hypothetical protein PRK78_004831 [Emydomyces testavorans]|uniref:Uncharacterized protein n=1 Tax=Emydomyces testavorans TaxID=2070801 RepID=A0AAF0DKX3_9EURO|nr:hypothetical protein PRK78_004831 [Emydomyces testavorans]